jgi:hypothetical protein
VNEYFRDQEKDDNILDKQASRESIHTGYRAVLDSKSSDETLVSNSPFNVLIFFSSSPCNLFSIGLMSCIYLLKKNALNDGYNIITNWPGTLCKLGAKTLNAVLQLPMAKICEAWFSA